MLPTEATVTIDHDEIQRWADVRDARPVRSLISGVVRLDLPRDDVADVERPIGWDEWFAAFDRQKLAFLYVSRHPGDIVPTYNELVRRAA